MKDVIDMIAALVFSGALFFGTGYTIKQAHDIIKKEALEQVSKGLSSSEELANGLTGETLDY